MAMRYKWRENQKSTLKRDEEEVNCGEEQDKDKAGQREASAAMCDVILNHSKPPPGSSAFNFTL